MTGDDIPDETRGIKTLATEQALHPPESSKSTVPLGRLQVITALKEHKQMYMSAREEFAAQEPPVPEQEPPISIGDHPVIPEASTHEPKHEHDWQKADRLARLQLPAIPRLTEPVPFSSPIGGQADLLSSEGYQAAMANVAHLQKAVREMRQVPPPSTIPQLPVTGGTLTGIQPIAEASKPAEQSTPSSLGSGIASASQLIGTPQPLTRQHANVLMDIPEFVSGAPPAPTAPPGGPTPSPAQSTSSLQGRFEQITRSLQQALATPPIIESTPVPTTAGVLDGSSLPSALGKAPEKPEPKPSTSEERGLFHKNYPPGSVPKEMVYIKPERRVACLRDLPPLSLPNPGSGSAEEIEGYEQQFSSFLTDMNAWLGVIQGKRKEAADRERAAMAKYLEELSAHHQKVVNYLLSKWVVAEEGMLERDRLVRKLSDISRAQQSMIEELQNKLKEVTSTKPVSIRGTQTVEADLGQMPFSTAPPAPASSSATVSMASASQRVLDHGWYYQMVGMIHALDGVPQVMRTTLMGCLKQVQKFVKEPEPSPSPPPAPSGPQRPDEKDDDDEDQGEGEDP